MTMTKIRSLFVGLIAATALVLGVALQPSTSAAPLSPPPCPDGAVTSGDPLDRVKVESLRLLLKVDAVKRDRALAYDLRGPAPEKEQVFATRQTQRIRGDGVIKVAGQDPGVALKLDLVGTTEEEARVVAVEGRTVIRCQTKIVRDSSDLIVTVGGANGHHIKPGVLEREIVTSERIGGGKWVHTLSDVRSSEEQKKVLDARNGIEGTDDFYPQEQVEVGYAWTASTAVLNKVLGRSFTDVKGAVKVGLKFTKVEEVDGETVAVIETAVKGAAKMKKTGEKAVDAEMELKVTTWRALRTGVNVMEKCDGTIKISGILNFNNTDFYVSISGTIAGECVVTIK